MVNKCCVPTCKSTSYTPEVILFTFTTNPKLKKIWIEKIRSNPINATGKQKPFVVKKHTKVCSEHFLKSDIKFGSDRHRLKPEAVPSMFPWTNKIEKRKRGRRRLAKPCIEEIPMDFPVKEESITVEESVLVDVKAEIEEIPVKQEPEATIPNLEISKPKDRRRKKVYREPTSSDEELLASLPVPEEKTDLDFKTMYFDLLIEYNEYKKKTLPPALPLSSNPVNPRFCIENFLSDPEEFEYYTGLPDYSTCQLLLNILLGSSRKTKLYCNYSIPSKFSPKVLEYKRLSPENELFLVLVKLRHDFDYFHLAHLFRLIPSIVQNIFEAWMGHMCAKFHNLDIWPNRKTILTKELGALFKEFAPFVVASVNGVEFLLKSDKAGCVTRAKSLLVTDLIGAVIFVSNLFTNPPSDKELIEKSGLSRIIRTKIDKTCLYSNDALLTFVSCSAERFLEPISNVNIPVVQMKTIEFSLPAVDSVACKVGFGECDQIVIKKAFSRLLKYKILMRTFDFEQFDLFNCVWVVCCILANFQNPETLTRVVKKHCFQY